LNRCNRGCSSTTHRREVELPYVAFYRFDGDSKLVSERVVMNLGTLADVPARTSA
jgi:hypothetical protein